MTNRVIKFRAWDRENKKMQWPCEISIGDLQGSPIHRTFEHGSIETCPPNPGVIEDYELMQFIGLLDKNGKEIYEGDILLANKAWFELASNVGIVGSSGEKFVVHDASWDNWDFIQNRTTEVIGNIYENPDLV